jgi:methionyl-tRNA synthetase
MKPTWADFKAFCDKEKYDPIEWDSHHKTKEYVEKAYDQWDSGDENQTDIWKDFCTQWKSQFDVCLHCGEKIEIRNISGYCDHLQYPDYCDICSSKMSPEELRRIAKVLDGNEFWDDSVKMMIWAARLEGESI